MTTQKTTMPRTRYHRTVYLARPIATVWCIVWWFTLSGCAHAPPKTTQNPPDRLRSALIQDLARAGDNETFVLRHNPVICRCPEFELELGARWVRVVLQDSESPESEAGRLRTKARDDSKNERLQSYTVQGELSDTILRCGQGAPYLTLTLTPPPEIDSERQEPGG